MLGYRADELFGDHKTDPLEVSFYETQDLGNIDIPEWLIKHMESLDEEQKQFLRNIVEGNLDEIDKWYFQEIIKTYIGNRNFCVWLCKEPEDIWNNYVMPLDKKKITCDEFCKNEVSEYKIPSDAIKLADLGSEGALYCWKEAA